MNIAKSLILGSAATIVALGGAQAADLPLKAKAVEYVKVCSLYGAGFYYIPGTDTCIKLGGYLRADTSFNAAGAYDYPRWNGVPTTRASNDYIARARQDINIDTRTATEYGVVRTYFDVTFNWTTGSGVRAGSDDALWGGNNTGVGVYYAFIQFAGFTMGKAVSQFSTPWTGYPGNNTSFLIGGQDDVTGINQFSYTAQFGNGVSATVSLEDASGSNLNNNPAVTGINELGTYNSYNRSQLYFVGPGGATIANAWGGTNVPDIIGQIRVDQAWGLFQVSAAAHQIRPNFYGTDDKWGFAVMAALSLKNLPTGPGDSINVDFTYSNGASRYVIGGVTGDNFGIFGTGGALGFGTAALGYTSDAITDGVSIETTEVWGLRGAFNHNWDPYWSSSLFGSYTQVSYNNTAKAILQGSTICGGIGGGFCDPNFTLAQLGGVLRWTPVKNLTLSGEVMYSYIDQKNDGLIATRGVAAGRELKDQGTWTFGVRAQRNF